MFPLIGELFLKSDFMYFFFRLPTINLYAVCAIFQHDLKKIILISSFHYKGISSPVALYIHIYLCVACLVVYVVYLFNHTIEKEC